MRRAIAIALLAFAFCAASQPVFHAHCEACTNVYVAAPVASSAVGVELVGTNLVAVDLLLFQCPKCGCRSAAVHKSIVAKIDVMPYHAAKELRREEHVWENTLGAIPDRTTNEWSREFPKRIPALTNSTRSRPPRPRTINHDTTANN